MARNKRPQKSEHNHSSNQTLKRTMHMKTINIEGSIITSSSTLMVRSKMEEFLMNPLPVT